MKKAFFFFLAALTISTAHAKVKVFEDKLPVIPWTQFSFEQVQELTHSHNSDMIVEFNEGTVIPFQFLTKTRLLSSRLDPNLSVQVDKTCYFRIVNKKCYISDDLVNWERPEKMLAGKPTRQLTPNANQSGFTLETSMAPYEKEEDME